MSNLAKSVFCLILLSAVAAPAQLAVTVLPPRMLGQKADVILELKNEFPEKVESARAVCFLLDEQGKMIGYSTKWVIGGKSGDPGIESGATNSFHFIITTAKLTSTNVTAKVNFNRVVLEGGKLADLSKDVKFQNATQ